MEVKKQKLLAILGVVFFMLAIGIVFLVFKTKIIVFFSEPEILREWVEGKGFIAQIIFMLAVIIQVILAVIPGEPFEVAAGYAFGAVEGTVLCLLSTTIGGIIVFLLVRAYGIKLVKLFFSEERIEAIKFLKITKNKTILYFMIFMIPGTPKDLLCYFAGLTDMKLSIWIFISTIGRIPSIIGSTIGGNLLGTANYQYAILVFLITIAICVPGIIIFYKIKDKRKEDGKNDN